jgi:hypothetical protein
LLDEVELTVEFWQKQYLETLFSEFSLKDQFDSDKVRLIKQDMAAATVSSSRWAV